MNPTIELAISISAVMRVILVMIDIGVLLATPVMIVIKIMIVRSWS